MNEKPEAERWSMGEPHPNPLGDWVPYENYERLMTRLVEAKDKALRYDLDAAGISNREKEALELVELRAANERLREALLRIKETKVFVGAIAQAMMDEALQEVPR